MRPVCWEGTEKIQVETVPDPVILNARDAIIKVTTTAICGSDLHIYDGYIPTMQKGDVLGHEFMGEVVDVGKDNSRLKVGDRVVVPFTIAPRRGRQAAAADARRREGGRQEAVGVGRRRY